MKVGMFDYLQRTPPKIPYPDLFENHLKMVELADQAGMDFAFVAEHHLDGDGFAMCSSPALYLGAVSQRAKRIRMGPLGYVLPLWTPMRLAEEIASLDNLTNGRLECGLGNGATSFAFSAFNVDIEKKTEIFWEVFERMKSIWDNEIYLLPFVQKPYPPFWNPSRDRDSIKKTASLGMSTAQWCAPRLEIVRDLFDWYKDNLKPHKGREPNIAILREIFVAESDSRAKNEAGEHWQFFWRRRRQDIQLPDNIGVGRAQRQAELLDVDLSIQDSSFICGSPETVTEKIRKLLNDVGANCILCDFAFGAMESCQVMKSLDLFIEKVMPELRR